MILRILQIHSRTLDPKNLRYAHSHLILRILQIRSLTLDPENLTDMLTQTELAEDEPHNLDYLTQASLYPSFHKHKTSHTKSQFTVASHFVENVVGYLLIPLHIENMLHVTVKAGDEVQGLKVHEQGGHTFSTFYSISFHI